ncbi:Protein of unknown function [Amycolatopsis xylanica]|uniref:DinB-like domain-containing protein n=1 Tax=Amycolatopsis xylanica TaxID=589385 RepID=A0A1H2UX98_9PSEU|nr:DinB family protein [Amycolatopsis xylanica]SDW60628.1 Protein of unknown function [Amycolatopsis xylanica]
MNVAEVLSDGFGRIREVAHGAVADLGVDQLTWRVDGSANSIAWLVWHLTRVQDDHLADAGGYEQLWTAEGWSSRFALPFDDSATGYGHTYEEVGQVRAEGSLLLGYLDVVHERTLKYLAGLSGADLDRVVDESWDPAVTLGVRLVSVISDGLQHAGQAAFVKGLLPHN